MTTLPSCVSKAFQAPNSYESTTPTGDSTISSRHTQSGASSPAITMAGLGSRIVSDCSSVFRGNAETSQACSRYSATMKTTTGTAMAAIAAPSRQRGIPEHLGNVGGAGYAISKGEGPSPARMPP